MSSLVVDFDMEKSFHKSIKDARSELNKRVDDYTNIASRARSIPSKADNCSKCADYVQKKINSIQSKIDNLHALDEKVTRFMDHAEKVDKQVAERIKKDTEAFKKRTGIGKTSKSLWSSICEGFGDVFDWIGDGIKNIWTNVKQFYEDNKYWINIVVDVVLVAAAIAACIGTGGLALAVGIFFAVDSAISLIYDGAAAYQYYIKGNEAEAERLSGKGGKDGFIWVGTQIDNVAGTNFWAGTFGVIHTGLSICAIGYSFYKTGAQILKDLKLDKIKFKSLFNSDRKRIKWGSHFNKENMVKAIKNAFGLKKVQQKDVAKLRWKKILGFKVGDSIIKTPERAKQLIQLKYIYKSGKKIIKYGIKYFNNIKKGDFNPFVKTTKAIKDFYNNLKALPSGGVA